ncbi:MAG: CRISPR-associated endonuclease Cas1 [Sphingomonadaceae bacterium]|uniref:CRISPR-associated endonuclease Cas1 n=1 Tax=Thermaurantiacus sp. TaxID=2820283 RepID=UPI00298F27C5|nr:CRISPR-associated endonuclease Cas1 [Thermaurantiacus sp.]MCS6987690.1 CRISPR-associated endonuclease Cas1 [Sphingomonadaceae bacterium]MDW8415914.1 CRISPR-associated endonuclease Cas1 [Thermaurantiacus sp.]
MTSLYVDRRGVALSLDGDAIAFHEGDACIGTVPLGPVDRVYLRGDVRLSAGVLGRLGALGVGVVVLSGRRGEPTLMLPRPHNDARIRLAQLDAARDAGHALALARLFVAGRIVGQHDLLVEIRGARPDLAHPLAEPVAALFRMRSHAHGKASLEELRGLEGAAARHFFAGLTHAFAPSLGFGGRNRRPPRDPVNAVLSLGYTLLHAEAVLAAHGHGFDPHVGFLHGIDFGRESFACDLVEPLRGLVERLAWRLFAEQTLRERDFTTEPDGACLLQKAGRARFYEAVDPVLADARRRLDRILRALRRQLLGEEEGAIARALSAAAEDEPDG